MKGFYKCLCIAFQVFLILSLATASENGNAARRSKGSQFKNPIAANITRAGFFSQGRLAVKLKQDIHVLGKSTNARSLNAKLNKHNVYAIERAFPFLVNSSKKGADELLRIYYLKYAGAELPQHVAADFSSDQNVEYACGVPAFRLDDTPNDPSFNQQLHLGIVRAEQAWDVVKGETGDVVIAIVDGGTDWEHEDIAANIWVNDDEIANNGIDDDNNGFIDDIRGWNFATNSNDPKGRPSQLGTYQHGTHVSGIAAAVTNNAIGVSGSSWNCTIMPVNIASTSANNDSTLGDSFGGVVYAIDNDADIINASWGFTIPIESRSAALSVIQMEQDIIDFGLANGSLLVSSAGNDGQSDEQIFAFPANLNGVLSVGNTDNSDRKAFSSNYGTIVGVFAPGGGVLSTFPNNEFGNISGTSMSSPLVAGIAGLVKTLHPDWSPDQVREQVRVTADNIDSKNPNFAGLLGNGRVNAFRAVTESSPAVQVAGVSFSDTGGDGRVDVGEPVDLTVRFTNYLADVSNVSFNLTSEDANITLVSPNANLATLNTGDTSSVTFQFSLSNSVKDGYNPRFITNISSGQYSDRDFFEITLNPPQVLDHNTGTVTATITNKGNIGFTGFAGTPGSGFIFNGTNFLFEGSFILGIDANRVSDAIRAGVSSEQDDDFGAISPLILTQGQVSDEFGRVVLDDAFAENPIGVEISQESFAYQKEPFTDFVIFKYTIKNISGANISNLWAGLFFDWDINPDSNDHARFDQSKSLGYVLNNATNPTQIAATKVLTPLGATSFRAIDNPSEIYGGTGNDGFTDFEKWSFLSGGIQTQSLDLTDVSTLTSTGPFTLGADESVEVAFAVIGASSATDLTLNAQLAQQLWDNDLIPEADVDPPITTTSVLQNPAASKYADIVVVADRLLQSEPIVQIAAAGDTTTVSMSLLPGASSAYSGSFEFTETGAHRIYTIAVSATNGVDSTQSRVFSIALAKPGIPTIISTINNKATLKINEEAIQSETYFMADSGELDGDDFFSFGPKKEFTTALTLEIAYNDADFNDPGKIFIYQRRGDEWVALETRVFPALRKARANVSMLGKFKIASDADFGGTNLVPEDFSLSQNYPNPFNPTTVIEYALPVDDFVELVIFNALGQAVKTLHQGRQFAGTYQVSWDGTDKRGNQAASGIFFYRIKAGNFVKTQKMILLR